MNDTDKSQEELLAFVTDPKTIAAAVEGSMEKRQAVFDKSELEKALIKDFNKLYVKQFTVDWEIQRIVRAAEIETMSLDNLQALITQQCNQASRNRAQEVLNNLNTGIFFESSNPKPQFVKDCIMFELDKLEAERSAEFDEKRTQAKETEEE